jgi:ankyrin repeat protein
MAGKSGEAKILMNLGAPLDKKDLHGYTALDHALYNGDFKLSKLMFDRGAPTTNPLHQVVRHRGEKLQDMISLVLTHRRSAMDERDSEGLSEFPCFKAS